MIAGIRHTLTLLGPLVIALKPYSTSITNEIDEREIRNPLEIEGPPLCLYVEVGSVSWVNTVFGRNQSVA